MAGKGDRILINRMVHASIIDACRLSFATVHKYRHNNMKDLERLLASLEPEAGKLIVADGVFSMEGDIADLPELSSLPRASAPVHSSMTRTASASWARPAPATPEHFGLTRDPPGHGHVQQTFASIGGVVAGPMPVDRLP